jgi:hypothetical protein
MDKQRRTHHMASTIAIFEFSRFVPVRHLKSLCMQRLLTTITIALWMPVRLSATTPVP